MHEAHVIYKTRDNGLRYRCDVQGVTASPVGHEPECLDCEVPLVWAEISKGQVFTVGYDGQHQYILRALETFSLDKWLSEAGNVHAWHIKSDLCKAGLAEDVEMAAHVCVNQDKTGIYRTWTEV